MALVDESILKFSEMNDHFRKVIIFHVKLSSLSYITTIDNEIMHENFTTSTLERMHGKGISPSEESSDSDSVFDKHNKDACSYDNVSLMDEEYDPSQGLYQGRFWKLEANGLVTI